MSNTTYLITGSNKGIGRALVEQLLLRPRTTVVAAVRQPSDPSSSTLSSLPVATDSQLVVLQLRDPTDFEGLAVALASGKDGHKDGASVPVTHLDVVVANAGHSVGLSKSLLDTTAEDVLQDCAVNAAGPLRLFQATWPLLRKTVQLREGRTPPKFVLMSSSMGSVGVLEQENMPVGTSYGMSKAAANWFAKKASVEFKNDGLVVGILHPGWVKTAMGQPIADALGMEEPPTTAEESARLCLEQIDNWTLEKTGKFLTASGGGLPW